MRDSNENEGFKWKMRDSNENEIIKNKVMKLKR